MKINYRKAQRGNVTCSKCVYSRQPDWTKKRIRCMWGSRDNAGRGYTVGKNMTCDRAIKKGGK